jgi:hypothetical protein
MEEEEKKKKKKTKELIVSSVVTEPECSVQLVPNLARQHVSYTVSRNNSFNMRACF